MNVKDRLIIENFRVQRSAFVQLGDTVHEMLSRLVEESGIMVLGIEHRVKTESSLAGKLERNGDYYQKLDDLTDLLGARVICYFNDEVDIIGKMVEESFVIDWENSSDKRALIKEDVFGYLSLHYICSLPFGKGHPDEICGKRFEIQIRTNLQHTWAQINHDLGYKSEFGVPRVIARQFARIAGMLEIVDDEFVRARDGMTAYTDEIRKKITNNQADDVLMDVISLAEFVKRNIYMQQYMQDLADICGSELSPVNPESYVEQLRWLGKTTLGDMQQMLSKNRDLAYRMARAALEGTELDILSSTVGLKFLCRAELVNEGMDPDRIVEFMKLSTSNDERAKRQAKLLLESYESIKEKGID